MSAIKFYFSFRQVQKSANKELIKDFCNAAELEKNFKSADFIL
jgi:hypothetical protein